MPKSFVERYFRLFVYVCNRKRKCFIYFLPPTHLPGSGIFISNQLKSECPLGNETDRLSCVQNNELCRDIKPSCCSHKQSMGLRRGSIKPLEANSVSKVMSAQVSLFEQYNLCLHLLRLKQAFKIVSLYLQRSEKVHTRTRTYTR